jgi:hypothetical protein
VVKEEKEDSEPEVERAKAAENVAEKEEKTAVVEEENADPVSEPVEETTAEEPESEPEEEVVAKEKESEPQTAAEGEVPPEPIEEATPKEDDSTQLQRQRQLLLFCTAPFDKI